MGLIYDDTALDAAWDLVKDFSKEERHALRDGVPKQALALRFRNHTVRDLALDALKIAEAGLKRRNRQGNRSVDESIDPTASGTVAWIRCSGRMPTEASTRLAGAR